MSMAGLFSFARDVRAVGKELTAAELQTIFVRANINRIDDDSSNDKSDRELEHRRGESAIISLER